MKKFLFWTAVVVGMLAAVAVFMKRRSDREDGSWQGSLEDSVGSVTKAANDAMSGPDAPDKAKETIDAAAEGTKDRVDTGFRNGRDQSADERHQSSHNPSHKTRRAGRAKSTGQCWSGFDPADVGIVRANRRRRA